jgi:hypothetical protein
LFYCQIPKDIIVKLATVLIGLMLSGCGIATSGTEGENMNTTWGLYSRVD